MSQDQGKYADAFLAAIPDWYNSKARQIATLIDKTLKAAVLGSEVHFRLDKVTDYRGRSV
jgi:hypothetical protein